ncbi:MAG: site-2 protease family protein [Candidatus Portnoybacteria bacterium]
MFLTILIFILVLGLLIFVHELGHFIMAKRAGLRIEEFGFGLPPRVFGIKRGGTIYSLNLLPIGGFVKIFGENGSKEQDSSKDKRAFYNQTLTRRAIIILAGVIMNFILAAFLLGIGHWLGLPTIIQDGQIADFEDVRIQVAQVAPDSPAEGAEIRMGDGIKELAVDSEKLGVRTISQVQEFISIHKGEEISITIERGEDVFKKKVLARTNFSQNEGSLGIALVQTAIISQPWYKAIWMGFLSALTLVGVIVITLASLVWQLLTTGQVMIEGGGPVYIFNLTGQAAQLGFIYVLQFTAILSINLAIINILPFPALDGGRLIFLLIEKIKGSPVSQKIEGMAHTVGFVILILFMVAITWRDMIRLF